LKPVPGRTIVFQDAGQAWEFALPYTRNRILDDVAKLVTDAAGAAQGLRRDAETVMRSQVERMMRELDIPTREELEAVKEMARLAREHNERLERRLEILERHAGVSSEEAVISPAARFADWSDPAKPVPGSSPASAPPPVIEGNGDIRPA